MAQRSMVECSTLCNAMLCFAVMSCTVLCYSVLYRNMRYYNIQVGNAVADHAVLTDYIPGMVMRFNPLFQAAFHCSIPYDIVTCECLSIVQHGSN